MGCFNESEGSHDLVRVESAFVSFILKVAFL